MVLTAQADAVRAEPDLDRTALRNDILWDDEPDQTDERLTSAPTPLGSGANRRLSLAGAGTRVGDTATN